jgi:hypothetical protein
MWNAATAKGLRRVAEFCLDRPLRRGRLGHHVQLVGAFRGDAALPGGVQDLGHSALRTSCASETTSCTPRGPRG